MLDRTHDIERFCTSKLSTQEYKDLWFEYVSESISYQDLCLVFDQLQMKRRTQGFGWNNPQISKLKQVLASKTKKGNIQATESHEKTVDERKDDT